MNLIARDRVLERMRELLRGDPWRERYALLLALEHLDLGRLNDVLTSLEQLSDGPRGAQPDRLAELMRERFGR